MKLANAPGRKLTRQRGALARFPARAAAAAAREKRIKTNPRTAEIRAAEHARLSALCVVDDNFVRGHRTKKNRVHMAKLGRND